MQNPAKFLNVIGTKLGQLKAEKLDDFLVNELGVTSVKNDNLEIEVIPDSRKSEELLNMVVEDLIQNGKRVARVYSWYETLNTGMIKLCVSFHRIPKDRMRTHEQLVSQKELREETEEAKDSGRYYG